mgnify:CR=1 FL=1
MMCLYDIKSTDWVMYWENQETEFPLPFMKPYYLPNVLCRNRERWERVWLELVRSYSLSEKESRGGIRSLDAIVKLENFSSKLMLKKEKSNAKQNKNLHILI